MDKRIYWKISLLALSFTFLITLLLLGIAVVYPKQQTRKIDQTSTVKSGQTDVSAQFRDFIKSKEKLLKTEKTASFIAVGDISFSRGVERVVKYNKDINFPFYKTKDILSDADITYANLETPITEGEEIPDGSMVFRSNPGTEKALKWAGIDVVNLANNHTYNYDQKGLEDTFSYLNDAEIKYVGAGRNSTEALAPLIIEKNGIKFAILSYEAMDIVPPDYEATETKPGIAFMRIDQMTQGVQKAKNMADVVIVAMHAGEEYVPLGNDLQTEFAHAAIDAGAEIVLGDHPHVVQNAEIYKDKVIFYNLGNFVMDQMWSDDTRRSLIFKGIFSKKGLEKFYLTPVQIEHYSQPTPVGGVMAESIIKRLNLKLDTNYDVSFDKNKKDYTLVPNAMYTTVLGKNSLSFLQATKTLTEDLDNDSIPEKLILANGRVKLESQNKVVWESPENWWVDDMAISQSANDGRNLINMSVWKEGNFGESKPFWVKENDDSIKNHMFLFAYQQGEFQHVWQSSNLPAPNCSFYFKDIENDGKIELIAREGSYSDFPDCRPKEMSVWRWQGWGFYNQWRSAFQ